MRREPRVSRSVAAGGELLVTVGHPLVEEYLQFLTARARSNTRLAVAFDLKVFFSVIDKTPVRVTSADMAFIRQRRAAGAKVVRLDGSADLSPGTIRRPSSVSGFYAYLLARDTSVARNPVPQGLITRRAGERRRHRPLVRAVTTLPRSSLPPRSTPLSPQCTRRGTGP